MSLSIENLISATEGSVVQSTESLSGGSPNFGPLRVYLDRLKRFDDKVAISDKRTLLRYIQNPTEAHLQRAVELAARVAASLRF